MNIHIQILFFLDMNIGYEWIFLLNILSFKIFSFNKENIKCIYF